MRNRTLRGSGAARNRCWSALASTAVYAAISSATIATSGFIGWPNLHRPPCACGSRAYPGDLEQGQAYVKASAST
ncbi:hypothetical protein NL676_009888 [Syzygium grande]|nr:hypothetical protein NL676_009888 [Syzygium grande]